VGHGDPFSEGGVKVTRVIGVRAGAYPAMMI
jgi:hypothetical protein